MTAHNVDGRWTTPRVAPFSGHYRDVDPFISPDGRRLYFGSDRPRGGTGVHSLSIWYLERTANGWSEPMNPGPPLNSDSKEDVFASESRDGTLVFGSTREGKPRIYATRLTNGRWGIPRLMRFGSVINGVSNPLIAPSGRFIVLVMDRPGRGDDLFVSCRVDESWSEPRPLSDGVNSRYADFAPAVDPQESRLFFTSERPGIAAAQPDSMRPPGDIYSISLGAAGVRCP
jgi:Tol biopolymer transport system component